MRYGIILWATVLAVGTSIAANEKTASQQPLIVQLIEQLGDDSFRQRQIAFMGLREMGMSALPYLTHATISEDPEIASAAQHLVRLIKFADMSEPTLVSLHGKAMPARTVFEELSRQAATPVYFGDSFNNAPIDVEFEKTPYWEAFLHTCYLSGNNCDS